MANILSAKHLDIIDLLAQSIDLVPGFQHAYAFYYHPINEQIQLAHATNKGISQVSSFSNELASDIEKLRKSDQQIEWVNEKEIPFAKRKNKLEIQKEVFDELDHHILLYRVKSNFDNKYDLLYIFFKADASNFGIKNSANGLTTDQKSVISTLISNSFGIYQKQQLRNSEEQNLLRSDINLLQTQLRHMSSNNVLNDYQEQIKNYIYSIFEQKTEQLGFILQLSNESKKLIAEYTGDINSISEKVNQCVQMAYRAQNPMFGSILHIDEFVYNASFIITEPDNAPIKEISYADSRKHKSAQFLNNLENAARKVQSNGDNLTGANVGLAMDKSISAPAISEYIKKYKKPLKQLCAENPSQWNLIRKSFTPLKNIFSA